MLVGIGGIRGGGTCLHVLHPVRVFGWTCRFLFSGVGDPAIGTVELSTLFAVPNHVTIGWWGMSRSYDGQEMQR